MRRLVLLALGIAALAGCESIDTFDFSTGIYVSEAEEVWMHIRVEDELVVFYDSEGASVDLDGHIQGDELHRDTFMPFLQEERGEWCGDELWYEAANLDDMLTFQLHTTWFSWPYLVWDCDQEHIILSDHTDTMSCDIEGVCFTFSPLEQ